MVDVNVYICTMAGEWDSGKGIFMPKSLKAGSLWDISWGELIYFKRINPTSLKVRSLRAIEIEGHRREKKVESFFISFHLSAKRKLRERDFQWKEVERKKALSREKAPAKSTNNMMHQKRETEYTFFFKLYL